MTTVYPKDLLRQTRRKISKASCFVLMPFAPQFDEVYRLIHETLQSPEMNLLCRRADDFRDPKILETILKHIALSEYIVADLTGSNPNVFYELGIAHCIKNADKVVLLSQSMDCVPFDLRHLRCVVYEQSVQGLESLERELLATFQEVSRHSFRFRVWEGKRFIFAKKLVGRGRNLYDLTFECPLVGHGAVKLIIFFTEHSVDETHKPVESQFLFLSEDSPIASLENGPWNLHLVQSGTKDALLELEVR